MSAGELVFEGGKTAVRGGQVDKQMREGRFLFLSDLVCHAPIGHGFEGAEDFPDFVMGSAVFLEIVEGQLPFAGIPIHFRVPGDMVQIFAVYLLN